MPAQSDNRTWTSVRLQRSGLNYDSVFSGTGTFPSSSGGGASIELQFKPPETLEGDAWQFSSERLPFGACSPISKWSILGL